MPERLMGWRVSDLLILFSIPLGCLLLILWGTGHIG
jgi:hypothetical protein